MGATPCIHGTRITVSDVLDYMASGMPHQEILRDFPNLTEEICAPVWLLQPIEGAD